MTQTIDATYDGTAFRPDVAPPLPANTRVRLTIESVPAVAKKSGSFLKTARAMNLDGPSDWSSNLDEYLYGGKDLPE